MRERERRVVYCVTEDRIKYTATAMPLCHPASVRHAAEEAWSEMSGKGTGDSVELPGRFT